METVARGFQNPVFDAQSGFRAIMRAMARPGSVMEITGKLVPPGSLPTSAAAVCLALADFETPLWFSQSIANDKAAVDYILFHTGARTTLALSQAAFALVDLRKDSLDLSAFSHGTAEYPDRSTTLILIVDNLGAQNHLAVSGPGLKTSGQLSASSLPVDFAAQWGRHRMSFPLGIDLIFTADSQIACLPRSARLLNEAA